MKKICFLLPLFFFSLSTLDAQTPRLLADVNRTQGDPISSDPSAFTYNPAARYLPHRFALSGTNFFFRAFDPAHGKELWMGQGIKGPVNLVKDIVPGRVGSEPWDFCVFKGKVYFSAYTPAAGREPWVTDGTSGGTKMLADLLPGAEGGGFQLPIVMGGNLYFFARVSTGPDTYALFRFDGKTLPPVKVKGGFSGPWENPVQAGAFLLFQGKTAASGREAWVSDGTAKGTFMLLDYAGPSSGYCREPVVSGKEAWFCARDARGWRIWKTGGKKAVPTAPMLTGMESWSLPEVLGKKVVFFGRTGPPNKGGNPYVFDMAAGKISLLKSISSSWQPGYWSPFFLGGKLFFFGYDSHGSPPGPSLWSTDGTPAGTVRVVSSAVLPSGMMGGMENPAVSGKFAFFHLFSTYPIQSSLWRTDGTPAGTIRLQGTQGRPFSSSPAYITPVQKGVVFSARTAKGDNELFSSDGTPKGTGLLKNLAPGNKTLGSIPAFFSDLLGRTFFFTRDYVHPSYTLWITDGTAAGTKKVSSTTFDYVTLPFPQGDKVFFAAQVSREWSLWSSDGTAQGTRSFAKIPAPGWSPFQTPLSLGDRVVFKGYDPAAGYEPWVTDGTAAGTMLLKDIGPGKGSGGFNEPVSLGRIALFSARPAFHKEALWVTDGTIPGTREIPCGLTVCRNLVRMGGKVYFQGMAAGSRSGIEPWVSDGTPAGTRELVDLNPGSFDGFFSCPFTAGRFVYFLGNDGKNVPFGSLALFRTDGTARGTVLVHPGPFQALAKISGPWGRFTYGLPLEGNKAVFWKIENGRIRGPWVTDGTLKGTLLLKDLVYSYSSNNPVLAVRLGAGRVLFKRGSTSGEIWITDGTVSGTRPYTWLQAPYAKDPSFPPVLSGGRLIFSARDVAHGIEPWTLFPGATAQEVGTGTGPARLSSEDPRLGSAMRVSLSRLPAGSAGILLLGRAGSRPMNLGYGYRLYLDPALGILWAGPFGAGGTALFRIPNDPGLIGARLALQGMLFPSGSPPLGMDFTNGVFLTLGK